MKRLLLLILCLIMNFSLTDFTQVRAEGTDNEAETAYPFSLFEENDVDFEKDFRLESINQVAYGKVFKFIQVYDDCEVYGNEVVVTVKDDGTTDIDGEFIKISHLSETITEEQAQAIAKERLGGEVVSSEKKVYAYEHEPTFAYEIILGSGMKAFVSSLTGEILRAVPVKNYVQKQQTDAYGNQVTIDVVYDSRLRNYQLADYLRNIYVVDAKNKEDLGEATDYMNRDGVFEPIAVTSYMNVIKAYDFYADAENIGVSLKGINGANDDIIGNYEQNGEIPLFIFMHYGENFENAACSYIEDSGIAIMYVGDGNEDGMIYEPGKALDVLAHEYQHAITEYKANLEYSEDSGALSEAFSDIFGALIEGRDPSEPEFWTIGENAVNAPYTEVRSLIGGTYGQRYTISEKAVCRFPWHQRMGHDITCDYGGVHTNNTIVTHLQYELYNKLPQFFTRQNIGKLWYNTLCALTSNATFEEFAEKFLQTAIDLDFPEEVCSTIKETLIEENFMEEEIFYKVTFLDEANNVIGELDVKEGDLVTAEQCPVPPEKQPDEMHTYEFIGWDLPETITEDVTLKAEYKESPRIYEITLVNMNGKIQGTISKAYGDIIDTSEFTVPDAPGSDYIFDDWYIGKDGSDKADGAVVKGDMILYAMWEKEEAKSDCGCAGGGTIDFLGGTGGGIMCALLLMASISIIFTRRKTAK